jgi:hypothetical protein
MPDLKKLPSVKGFGEKTGTSGGSGLLLLLGVQSVTDQDHRNILQVLIAAKLSTAFQPVDFRHVDIHEDQAGAMVACQGQRVTGILCFEQ